MSTTKFRQRLLFTIFAASLIGTGHPASAAETGMIVEAGGVQVALGAGWVPLEQPTNFFTQKRAANAERQLSMNMGVVKLDVSPQQYTVLGARAFITGTDAQLDYLAAQSGLTRLEIDKILASEIGKKFLDRLMQQFRQMRLELVRVISTNVSGTTRYEVDSKLTVLESGQVVYGRQFILPGAAPGEIVTISFGALTDGVFKQADLDSAIKPATRTAPSSEYEAINCASRGIEKGQKGDYAGAEAEFTKAIVLKPDFAEAYNARGKARGSLAKSPKDLGDVVADYTKAIALKPDFDEAYLNRGVVEDLLGDKKKALADFSKAVELKPDYAMAYFHRGMLRATAHDYTNAMADLNKAIELKPAFAEAYSHRGLLKATTHDRRGAVADLNKAIELKPDYAQAYYDRGSAELLDNRTSAALADYNTTIKLDPNNAEAYCFRGVVKTATHDFDGAMEDFNKAIELNSTWPPRGNATVYKYRGDLKKAKGDTAGAQDDYRKAAQLGGN